MSQLRRRVWLGVWEEAVEILRELDLEEGRLRFDDFTLLPPPKLLRDIPEIRLMINQRVRLLRTDITDKPLLIKIDKEYLACEYRISGLNDSKSGDCCKISSS